MVEGFRKTIRRHDPPGIAGRQDAAFAEQDDGVGMDGGKVGVVQNRQDAQPLREPAGQTEQPGLMADIQAGGRLVQDQVSGSGLPAVFQLGEDAGELDALALSARQGRVGASARCQTSAAFSDASAAAMSSALVERARWAPAPA